MPQAQINADICVMTVDDDANMRSIVASVLRGMGVQNFQRAPHGRAALDILARNKVDLIICDCEMAPMDGLTFLAELRALERKRALPVIMLTASTDPEHEQRARALHVAAWLNKPISINGLQAHMQTLLGLAHAAPAPAELDRLAAEYEAKLPAEVQLMEDLARSFGLAETVARVQATALQKGLHNTAGTAGTFGYDLITDIARDLNIVLKRALAASALPADLEAELGRVVLLGISAMRLVVLHKLRGRGSRAGERMRAQFSPILASLQLRLLAHAAPPAGCSTGSPMGTPAVVQPGAPGTAMRQHG
jgi:two-component system chemotaxis response regulator CheY